MESTVVSMICTMYLVTCILVFGSMYGSFNDMHSVFGDMYNRCW